MADAPLDTTVLVDRLKAKQVAQAAEALLRKGE